jgi:hypothetical protein
LEELRNPSREKQEGSMEFTSTTFKGLNITTNGSAHDKNFILSIIKVLKDIDWLAQDKNGKYSRTMKIQVNTHFTKLRCHEMTVILLAGTVLKIQDHFIF